MVEFRALLNEFASEKTLKLTADRMTILNRLVEFAEKIRTIRMREGIDPLAPTLLKHALPAFIMPELAKIFDLKIVGVLRDPKEIEATRVRRGWSESFGRVGAGVVYNSLFKYIFESKTPFRLVRFSALLDEPSVVFNTLRDFVGCSSSDENKIAAINFVTRSSVNKN
jgi:hypothetical protein